MKQISLAALIVALGVWGAGAQTTLSLTNTVNSAVPDGNASGLSSARTVNGTGALVQNVSLTLDISGGYNGDLYAYLTHDGGGFVVLLNRAGRTAGDSFGYSDAGLSLTLSDAGANNIHFYQNFSPAFNGSGQLTGLWQPDGRNVDPATVDGTETPDTSFASFNGQNADGDWTLFLADLSSGQTSTLNSWVLTIQTVPEPATAALIGLGGLALLFRRRRK
jgi:subtilisin-like proprotein convertase family protein